MLLEDRVYLQLRPDKIATLSLIRDTPPKPPLDDAFYHQGIVPSPNIRLVDHFFRLRLDKQTVRVVDLPQEIDIVEYLFLILLVHASLFVQPTYKGILLLEEESVHNKLLRAYLTAHLKVMRCCVETVNALLPLISNELFFPWLELHGRLLLQYLL